MAATLTRSSSSMSRRRCLPSLLLIFLLPSFIASSTPSSPDGGGRENRSSSLGWSTTEDEADLLSPSSFDEGGFPTLESMLQWAIGHSDPEKLKENADGVQRLSVDDLNKRQADIKELMEKLKMPSDAQLMQIAIDDLNNSSISVGDRARALNELFILVEPIDNANNLDKLGGLVAVVRELYNVESDIRTISAWILGKASQNNAHVQKQILAHGALTKLMEMVNSNYTEEAIKALYAISCLIRNNDEGQALFFSADGGSLLQGLLSNSSADIRLQKKAVFLLADLASYQKEEDQKNIHFFRDKILLKSLVNLISTADLDLKEKALLAVRSLMELSFVDALIFKDFCALDVVLDRMKEQLETITLTERQNSEYAADIQRIAQEISTIYHRKLHEMDLHFSSHEAYLHQ